MIVSFVMGWTTSLRISSTSIAGWIISLLSANIFGTDHVGDSKYPFEIALFNASWLMNAVLFGHWKEGRLHLECLGGGEGAVGSSCETIGT